MLLDSDDSDDLPMEEIIRRSRYNNDPLDDGEPQRSGAQRALKYVKYNSGFLMFFNTRKH